MRDHYFHVSHILAGMWGGVKSALPTDLCHDYLKSGRADVYAGFFGGDQVSDVIVAGLVTS